ncbi:hypothetical protein CHARACLAT_024215 [Characodon lateralis]|uniref:40S ribosomal protein S12 n=1 Tax=Characodon lateralis TaxID=208331 RepID=A0ABU7D0E7_9TELE|nr:hypothetical protein [Characodon lateralis]
MTRPRSGLNIDKLPLTVVENQAGGSELRGLTLLPALEAVQAILTRPEQNLLQAVQASHQHRCVFIVGILGGVHCSSKAADKCLEGGHCEKVMTEAEKAYRTS